MSLDWRSSPAFQKGQIGEQIVDEFLLARGFVPYRPIVGAAHPFDRLVASRDKRTIVVVEVKAKPARTNYADTGINMAHYEGYRAIRQRYSIPVFLAFVDERARRIYGEFLHILERPRHEPPYDYPLHQCGIVYFPVSAMRTIADLTESQAASLAALRRSKHDDAQARGAAA